MATRGQTHNKRAREMALREKRERKQLKKDQRAAGLLPYYDDEGVLVYPSPEIDGETDSETDVETVGETDSETDAEASADAEQTPTAAE